MKPERPEVGLAEQKKRGVSLSSFPGRWCLVSREPAQRNNSENTKRAHTRTHAACGCDCDRGVKMSSCQEKFSGDSAHGNMLTPHDDHEKGSPDPAGYEVTEQDAVQSCTFKRKRVGIQKTAWI